MTFLPEAFIQSPLFGIALTIAEAKYTRYFIF